MSVHLGCAAIVVYRQASSRGSAVAKARHCDTHSDVHLPLRSHGAGAAVSCTAVAEARHLLDHT